MIMIKSSIFPLVHMKKITMASFLFSYFIIPPVVFIFHKNRDLEHCCQNKKTTLIEKIKKERNIVS